MRASSLPTLLVPFLAVCSTTQADTLPWHPRSKSIIPIATPASAPRANVPTPTRTFAALVIENLELRQAPAVPPANAAPPPAAPAAANPAVPPNPAVLANPINPAVPNPAVVPGAVPANPAVPAQPVVPVPPAANPAPPATTVAPVAPIASDAEYSITVQWAETRIGGTLRTWVPKTITLKFGPVMTQAAQPGKGEIGLGTLTGKAGVTKTVTVNAAPAVRATGGVERIWRIAALGVGVGLGAVV